VAFSRQYQLSFVQYHFAGAGESVDAFFCLGAYTHSPREMTHQQSFLSHAGYDPRVPSVLLAGK